jgi:hypothetical protein
MINHDEVTEMIKSAKTLIELAHAEKGRIPDSALKYSQAALNVAHAISVLRNLDK